MHSVLRFTSLLFATLLLAACGAKEEKKPATQTAARVNDNEITVHQINHVLSRLPGVPEAAAPKLRQDVLEKLIDQQLAVEQALSKKLERQPEVMAAIEAGKRDILARAFLDQIIAAQPKPGVEEAKKYYAETPQLFSQRRIYSLQEIALDTNPALLPALREKAATVKSFEDIANWLKEKGVRFTAQSGIKPAEQIPLEVLSALHAAQPGQNVVIPGAQGLLVLHVVAAQAAPVDEATALPRIQQFLANQRGMKAVENEMKQLRAKAKVEYLGAFSATPASDTPKPAAVTPAATTGTADPATGNAAKAVGGLK